MPISSAVAIAVIASPVWRSHIEAPGRRTRPLASVWSWAGSSSRPPMRPVTPRLTIEYRLTVAAPWAVPLRQRFVVPRFEPEAHRPCEHGVLLPRNVMTRSKKVGSGSESAGRPGNPGRPLHLTEVPRGGLVALLGDDAGRAERQCAERPLQASSRWKHATLRAHRSPWAPDVQT